MIYLHDSCIVRYKIYSRVNNWWNRHKKPTPSCTKHTGSSTRSYLVIAYLKIAGTAYSALITQRPLAVGILFRSTPDSEPLPAKMSFKLRVDYRGVTTAQPPVGDNLHLLLPFVLILPLETVMASPTASRFRRRAVGLSMGRTIIVLPLLRRVSICPSTFLVPAYTKGSSKSKYRQCLGISRPLNLFCSRSAIYFSTGVIRSWITPGVWFLLSLIKSSWRWFSRVGSAKVRGSLKDTAVWTICSLNVLVPLMVIQLP